MHSMKLKIYTDGGSRGNPGPAAAGYVITDESDKLLEEGGLYLGITTNNQAEHKAVQLALDKAKTYQPHEIEFYADSQLVVMQLTGKYRVKHEGLKPVVEQTKQLIAQFPKITFQHVLREYNKLADRQVNLILDAQVK